MNGSLLAGIIKNRRFFLLKWMRKRPTLKATEEYHDRSTPSAQR